MVLPLVLWLLRLYSHQFCLVQFKWILLCFSRVVTRCCWWNKLTLICRTNTIAICSRCESNTDQECRPKAGSGSKDNVSWVQGGKHKLHAFGDNIKSALQDWEKYFITRCVVMRRWKLWLKYGQKIINTVAYDHKNKCLNNSVSKFRRWGSVELLISVAFRLIWLIPK